MQSQQVEKRDYLTISEMWTACLKHWWWFVLSVLVMSSLAFLFMKKSKPIYVRSASLMVLTSRNNDNFKYSDLKIRGLGVETSKTYLPNEIEMLRSPVLMKQVIEKLNLDVEYRTPGKYFNQLVYGKEVPVSVSFADPSLSGAHFKLSLQKDGKFELTEFSNRLQEQISIRGQLGDTLMTPLGKVVIKGRPNYSEVYASVPVLLVTKYQPSDVALELLKGLTVERPNQWADAIWMTFVDQSGERADDVLNYLMAIYDDNAMKLHSQKAEKTVEFLQERVDELSGRLGTIDDGIALYKGANLISNVESNQGMYMRESYEQAGMINKHAAQLSALNYVKEVMAKNTGTNQYIPSDVGIETGTITKQISNYNALQLERNNLAAATGESNPQVTDLDRQLDIYRGSILSSIEQTTDVMQAQLDGMENMARGIDYNLAKSAHQEMHLISTGRMRKVLEELYAFLYLQKERNAIALSHNVSTIHILQKSFGPQTPIAPLKKQIMLIGLVVGLAIPFVGVFFKTISDDKVYQQSDLADLQVPIIGEVPSMEEKISWLHRKKGEKHVTIFVEEKARDTFNECMRLLRTNLEFMKQRSSDSLVIMMTSAEPNCGKSFVSSNLAASMSLVGKKVILVDLDMRKATASALIKDVKKGVSSFLSYRSNNIDELICKDAFFKGMDLLPVGSLPPNPTELLHSARLGELMGLLKENYNCIIIDCPPVDIVADDDIVNVYADVTLFVLRAGLTNVEMLSDANMLYAEKRFVNMCAVLNGVKHVKGGKNHYYGDAAV